MNEKYIEFLNHLTLFTENVEGSSFEFLIINKSLKIQIMGGIISTLDLPMKIPNQTILTNSATSLPYQSVKIWNADDVYYKYFFNLDSRIALTINSTKKLVITIDSYSLDDIIDCTYHFLGKTLNTVLLDSL